MSRLIASHDWTPTQLGSIEDWPQSLRSTLSACLASPLVTAVLWGPEYRLLYNDGYAATLADRHPWALGRSIVEVWSEISDLLGGQLAEVARTGRGFVTESQRLVLNRAGQEVETHWLYTFAPVRGEDGSVVGILNTAVETTAQVLAERARVEAESRLGAAMEAAGLSSDFRALFEAAPTPFVVVAPPEWTIVAANDARLRITGSTRAQEIGRKLFDLYPDDPDDPEADGVRNLTKSLERVVATGATDIMPVQRYPVRDASGRFVERWWTPINSPVVGSDGKVALVIHRVEEVTELVRLRGEAEASDHLAREQQAIIARLRESDAALRSSEERNRRIVEGIKDYAVFTISPDRAVIDWTPGAEAVFGWTADEIVGQPADLVFTPEDRAAGVPEQELATAREKGCANDERWHLRRDGSRFFVDGSVRPLHDATGTITAFIKIARDETERRAVEAKLRASEEFNRQILASSADCIKVLDLEGRLEFMSEGGMCIMEVEDFGDVEGACWPDFWSGEEHAQALQAINEARQGGTGRFQGFAKTFNGTPRWWDVIVTAMGRQDGEPQKLLSISRDITASKQAEVQLRELNETLEARVAERTAERDRMWDTSPDLMVVVDFDGVFRRVNPAWTAVLGYTAGELVGHHVNQFVVDEDHHETTGAYEFAAEGGSLRIENRYRHKDGSIRRISWAAAPAGDVIYATGRDVTAERQAAEDLARAEDALRQAHKMEAVGQLTGGLAHDFNNLLTGMMGNLELLQLRVARGRFEDVDRHVSAAQGAGRRAASLTQRLLAFSRRQTLDPKPTNVNRLIAGMEELLRRTVGATVDIEVVGAGGLWTTLIDAGQLENALLNLCINARDAMPHGGKITVETANKWLDERAAAARDLVPGQYLSVCVTDTGTGMTPEVIERAFEPFYTTKPLGEGTGLGLSMIYGFARQSGGQVRIYSELGQGTTMCIYLPRYIGDAEGDEAVALTSTDGGGSGETVLVVDDEATIRHLIDEVLDEMGYTVIGGADGAAGLKVLQSGSRIDLLITDVGLPNGMNGRQLADAARVIRPDLKILFITGYAENAAVGNGLLEPGMSLLTKPFTLDDLKRKVSEMLSAA
ncbi:PAS domain S-box protein [Sphingomonas sp.]|uniref:PAS domain S-box protein n=1 Tax=Sphingomonas sp. TaxID=28214 RepID=UPI0025F6AEC7|nr:PAS domain S-box protein [Sphingomonas sp.]MBV9527671.1 PAS domain S-box protein [Sphingomonas sp.]MBV9841717.1 PAS domain S-box protein [Sphingomonadaceae bacterium]